MWELLPWGLEGHTADGISQSSELEKRRLFVRDVTMDEVVAPVMFSDGGRF